MADRSSAQLEGILEDVLIKVGKFIFHMDFVVIDIEEDKQVPLLLGRPFLATRVDECLKHSYCTHVGFSFSRLFYSNFIVFVARLLNWCLVWMQVHWSKKATVGSNFGAYGGYA